MTLLTILLQAAPAISLGPIGTSLSIGIVVLAARWVSVKLDNRPWKVSHASPKQVLTFVPR